MKMVTVVASAVVLASVLLPQESLGAAPIRRAAEYSFKSSWSALWSRLNYYKNYSYDYVYLAQSQNGTYWDTYTRKVQVAIYSPTVYTASEVGTDTSYQGVTSYSAQITRDGGTFVASFEPAHDPDVAPHPHVETLSSWPNNGLEIWQVFPALPGPEMEAKHLLAPLGLAHAVPDGTCIQGTIQGHAYSLHGHVPSRDSSVEKWATISGFVCMGSASGAPLSVVLRTLQTGSRHGAPVDVSTMLAFNVFNVGSTPPAHGNSTQG